MLERKRMQSTTKFGTVRNNPFSEFKANWLLVWLLLVYLFCLVGYALILTIIDIGVDFDDPIREYIVYCLSFTGILLYALRRMRQLQISWRSILGSFPKNYRWMPLLGLTLVLILLSLGVAFLSISLLSLSAPTFTKSLLDNINEADAQVSSVPVLYHLLQFIAVVIVAPVIEEFIFRGILIHIWATKWKTSSAIILSSLIFGLLHPNPIGISIAGIVWTILYIRTGNLFVPIVAHGMNNTLAIALPFFVELVANDSNSSKLTLDVASDLWKLGLPLTAISAPLIIGFIYRKWSSENATLPYFANVVKVK